MNCGEIKVNDPGHLREVPVLGPHALKDLFCVRVGVPQRNVVIYAAHVAWCHGNGCYRDESLSLG